MNDYIVIKTKEYSPAYMEERDYYYIVKREIVNDFITEKVRQKYNSIRVLSALEILDNVSVVEEL